MRIIIKPARTREKPTDGKNYGGKASKASRNNAHNGNNVSKTNNRSFFGL